MPQIGARLRALAAMARRVVVRASATTYPNHEIIFAVQLAFDSRGEAPFGP
jgi:hypothetical protein